MEDHMTDLNSGADEAARLKDVLEGEDLYQRLKSWFLQDRAANSDWYREAESDYAFHAGHGQWEEVDRNRLASQNRPCVTFNRIAPVIAAVTGMEVANRQEVRFIPRTTVGGGGPGADDSAPAELLTQAAIYLRDQCNAEDEESDAFQDVAICGMGWTETRIDYDEDPAGKVVVDRVDPMEMTWDAGASKRNLSDARRLHRHRQIDIETARAMFPGLDDEALDAAWARGVSGASQSYDYGESRYSNPAARAGNENRKVTIVEVEWRETETTWRVADPQTGEVMEIDDEAVLARLKERAAEFGKEAVVSKRARHVFRRAFLGAVLLETGFSQSQAGFKFKAITGNRDRNRRQWVGLVRPLRDPQRWANALFSSVLHAIQTSGKGIMAERGAFDNDQQAEADWANVSRIVWMRTGALSGPVPKIMPKPQASLPEGTDALMQFALQSMRDVTGISVEMLGLADREQAASLEYQRRQSATAILAPFFDGLRRYRKEQGRLLMRLIHDYLSDGRLIRIAGPGLGAYVPLIRDESVMEFDIVVDDAPASPNQKEASWAVLREMLPIIMQQNLPIEAWARLLKASPLPNSLAGEFVDILERANAPASAPGAQAGPGAEELRAQQAMRKEAFEASARQEELALRRLELETRADIARRQLADKEAQRRHELTLHNITIQ
jgi:hypothetical protein